MRTGTRRAPRLATGLNTVPVQCTLTLLSCILNGVQLATVPTERLARTRLGEAAVVDAALTLADSEGLEALTIRRLAQALGVTPTALYWHFADKQAVLDALGDRLWAEVLQALSPAAAGDAWAQIRAAFEAMVTVFRRHPALAHLAPSRAADSQAGLAISELTLSQLTQAGYDDQRAADTGRILLGTALMLVTSQPGVAIPDRGLREDVMRRKRAAILTLPPGQFPSVQRAASYLYGLGDDDDAYFQLGTDIIIGGLRSGTAEPGTAEPGTAEPGTADPADR